MEIIHQLVFRSREEPQLLQGLEKFGVNFNVINLPYNSGQSISVQISESDNAWSTVRPFLKNKNILHSFETYFSVEEILEAEWLRVISTFDQGYPQPERSWVRNPHNYIEVCQSCGIHKQVKPFHIAKEPKLGDHDFMSLIWIPDALFVTPKVLSVFEEKQIQGFETWEVLIHKRNTPANSIVQMFIPSITKPGLIPLENQTKTVCVACGVAKYEYHRHGKMEYKRTALPPNLDIVRTSEWFGSGHLAFNEILVSNYLAKIIIENEWTGLRMKVIQPV